MQFTSLKLHNWGPFFGEHQIELSVERSAPVVIFRGENMRGKTSILRALVWVLYGEIREQDGRTPLDVARMVNIDAVSGGEAEFGVTLVFTHEGNTFTLHRSSSAVEERPGRVRVEPVKVDLLPNGGHAYPAAQVPDVINGILSREISDFFLFDGEMLNRFEERLREDRKASGGFVRSQVERALGLPFLTDLASDIDAVLSETNTLIHQTSRRVAAHDKESEKYRQMLDELRQKEENLQQLRLKEKELDAQIADYEAQLAKVDEIKDAYHERKALQRELDAAESQISDLKLGLAERAESVWWLPMARRLFDDMASTEQEIVQAETLDRENLKISIRIDALESQLGTGFCAACGQATVHGNEDELREEIQTLRASLAEGSAEALDSLRAKRDRLRRFSTAASALDWVRSQETDIRRLEFANDRRRARVRVLSEQLSGTSVEIDALERNLADARATRTRVVGLLEGLEAKRSELKAASNQLSAKLAARPGVDPIEKAIQAAATDALDVVGRSFDGFRSAMRQRVESATSDLFKQLTTEKEYSGVAISEQYQLSVMDQQGRPASVLSAGANQILTMAFIGALAECSVDEAPMVMDTPFGRLDVEHRRSILRWVQSLNRQVIFFVQSGEFDPERDRQVLEGKIGREYEILRVSPIRSEIGVA
jgi:DNA sulfur modification protein DndD